MSGAPWTPQCGAEESALRRMRQKTNEQYAYT